MIVCRDTPPPGAHGAELFTAPPLSVGPLLLGSHMAVCMLYTALKLWQSIDAHSGLELPCPLSPWSIGDAVDCASAHSFHHSKNSGCYGGYTMFWDWLCGTDRPYREYVAKCKAAAATATHAKAA